MPSIFGHALAGASAARLASPVRSPRRLYLLSLACSILPDFDVVTFAFGFQYSSFFGHRGIFHSIAFSLVIGLAGAAVYLRSIQMRSSEYRQWATYFTLVALSHPILDAMTTGGHGVAFFSPINLHRYFYRFRPIYVSPLSISEFFSLAGARILANEAILLGVLYLSIVLLTKLRSRVLVLRITYASICFLLILFFAGIVREELIPSINPANVYKIEPTLILGGKNGINEIPTDHLPGHRLMTNYQELSRNGIFNKTLTPHQTPWSGSFFPFWLGGAAGRWQESYLQSIWKSLWGDTFLSKPQLMDLLYESSPRLLRLSPTEKYDLAIGDYYLSATRAESKVRGRGYLDINPDAPVWEGYCHSVSMASLYEKEPKKEVTVLNADGNVITFYPNDLKALLGIAYAFPASPVWYLGNRCQLNGPASSDCIDVNPAALVIALANRIGLAKTSFFIETEPFHKVNNGPIRNAEIRIINPPYFPADRNRFYEVDDLFVKFLVDVEIHLTLSKISPVPSTIDEEELTYRAILGLDQNMNLIGGRWEDPFHHPDFAWGNIEIDRGPELIGSFTKANVKIEWAILKALLEQSANLTPQSKPLSISELTSHPVMHGLNFSYEPDGISGRISYIKYGNPIEIYGYILGKEARSINSVELFVDKKSEAPSVLGMTQTLLPSATNPDLRFFRIQAPGSIEDLEGVKLRFPMTEDRIEFSLPTRKKFENSIDPSLGYP